MLSENIGQLLRARRKFLQLRQRDLAELAGVTLRGLTEIEKGRGNPTLKQLAKIASVLGLEVTLTGSNKTGTGTSQHAEFARSKTGRSEPVPVLLEPLCQKQPNATG